MLVVMKNDATEEQVLAVIQEIEKMGYRGIPMPGAERTAVCIVGNKGPVDDIRLLTMEGVKEATVKVGPLGDVKIAVAHGLVCGRRRGVRLGLDRAEGALRDRQP